MLLHDRMTRCLTTPPAVVMPGIRTADEYETWLADALRRDVEDPTQGIGQEVRR